MAVIASNDRPRLSLSEQLGAAMDWWREAGVDCAFVDEPQAWLALDVEQLAPPASIAPAASSVEAPAPAAPQFNSDGLPGELAAFRQWWTDPANPLPTGLGPRIAPSGPVGAALMLVVPMPEEADHAALLQGPQGAMLGVMLARLGFAREDCYFAAALPGHLPLPDWEGLAASGLGAVLAHHVALVQPRRLLLLGNALAEQLGAALGDTPALSSFAPEHLLASPRQRARLWQRLLDWTAA